MFCNKLFHWTRRLWIAARKQTEILSVRVAVQTPGKMSAI